MPAKYVARLAAEVQRQAQQFVGTLDVLGLAMRTTRRSTLAKSAKSTVARSGPWPAATGPGGFRRWSWPRGQSSFESSIIALILSFSTRVISGRTGDRVIEQRFAPRVPGHRRDVQERLGLSAITGSTGLR